MDPLIKSQLLKLERKLVSAKEEALVNHHLYIANWVAIVVGVTVLWSIVR